MLLNRTSGGWLYAAVVLSLSACSSGDGDGKNTAVPDSGATDDGSSSPAMTDGGTQGEPDTGDGTGQTTDGTEDLDDAGEPAETLDSGTSQGSADAGSDPTEPDDTSTGGGEHVDAGGADADTPPPEDAGQHSGEDGGPTPGDDGPWLGCPDADSVEQDLSSPLTLTVTQEAVYCATYNETRTLQEELAAKMQLRIAPGNYRVSNAAATNFTLPACIRTGMGEALPATAGQTEYSTSVFDDLADHSLSAQATFAPAGSHLLRVHLQTTTTTGDAPGFVLDGTESGLDFDAYHSLDLCDQAGAECFPDRIFDACEYASGVLNLHEVTLDAGSVAFELRLGDSFAGTEPGAYVRASGTYNGQAFDQTDYFKLIYHPTHHHFERAFVVLFDAPIDGTCGLEVSALEPFGDDVPDQAFAVDCDLNRIETLAVLEHELTR